MINILNKCEKQYLNLIKNVLNNGIKKKKVETDIHIQQ